MTVLDVAEDQRVLIDALPEKLVVYRAVSTLEECESQRWSFGRPLHARFVAEVEVGREEVLEVVVGADAVELKATPARVCVQLR
jgi:hypothetical protein